MSELRTADLSKYSVYDLYGSGSRFTDDFEPEDAVLKYMKLHPDADEAAVRKELQDAIDRQDG